MNNKKNGYIGVIIFINIFILMIVGGTLSFSKAKERYGKYTKNWEEVDVTVDDVEFVNDGTTTKKDSDDHDVTIYKFKMKQILKYTYNGKDYAESFVDTYESSNKDFNIVPRHNYKDNRKYKVNPSNPTSISVSYSDLPESALVIFDKVEKMLSYGLLGLLVIVDGVFVCKKLKKKKVVFEEEK